MVVWIGYIQWLHDNGFGVPSDPILKPLHNVRCMDAILIHDNSEDPVEPAWPEADVIVGNPPFLGGKRLRTGLGDEYVRALFALYDGRVPREADLVTYWFERARELIAAREVRRVGLLATQSIRAGANRRVLERIKSTGDIFYAQADRPWVLDGAAVRVAMVGFDEGSESHRLLNESKDDPATVALANARQVPSINADLTAGFDITQARRLVENVGLSFMGTTKGGPFELRPDVARRMLDLPLNPNGRPNQDVVKPWVNGLDLTRRPRGIWIIDFGAAMPEEQAALYEAPFEYVREHVRPDRLRAVRVVDPDGTVREQPAVRRVAYRQRWWLHVEPRPALRMALGRLRRYVATSRVSRYRTFIWLDAGVLPDSRVYVFAREDDYFLGVLQSRVHVVWALKAASRHGVGNDPTYNNTTCFETFPFPWPLGLEHAGEPQVEAIGTTARELVTLRDRWLNPPGATKEELQRRTLAELYAQGPTWLAQAHRHLDDAVLAAYGWSHDLPDATILECLLRLNLGRPALGSPVPQEDIA